MSRIVLFAPAVCVAVTLSAQVLADDDTGEEQTTQDKIEAADEADNNSATIGGQIDRRKKQGEAIDAIYDDLENNSSGNDNDNSSGN